MLSTKVTRQIAAREGVDPLHLDKPLYDVIDVGALETMVESASKREGERSKSRLRTTVTRSSSTRRVTSPSRRRPRPVNPATDRRTEPRRGNNCAGAPGRATGTLNRGHYESGEEATVSRRRRRR
ncbi:HalOD1 output domain-containing protein [Halosimplex aquaticum]